MTDKAHERLRAWIEARGLRYGHVATLIGCPQSTLSQWVTGKRPPSRVYRARIEELTEGAIRKWEWEL